MSSKPSQELIPTSEGAHTDFAGLDNHWPGPDDSSQGG